MHSHLSVGRVRKQTVIRLIVVSGVALVAWSFLASATTLSAIWAEFRQTGFAWVAVGMGLSTVALGVSGMRLQVALAAVGERLSLGRAVQWTLWNQAAAVLTGGPMTGDLAGASIAARSWRRNAAVFIAAAPLNRAIGMVGLVITGAVLLAVTGGFSELRLAETMEQKSFPWMQSLIGILGVSILLSLRDARKFALGIANRLRSGALKVLHDSGLAAKALGIGVAVQLLQGGVTMIFLAAVHGSDFPWLTGAWTFVAIGAASMIPSVLVSCRRIRTNKLSIALRLRQETILSPSDGEREEKDIEIGFCAASWASRKYGGAALGALRRFGI